MLSTMRNHMKEGDREKTANQGETYENQPVRQKEKLTEGVTDPASRPGQGERPPRLSTHA